MRWIHRDTILPIHMSPNDKLELVYDLDYTYPVVTKGFFGRRTELKKERLKKTLGKYPVDREMVVDVVGVIEFDADELEELGLSDALVGVFGESDGNKVADVRITEEQGKALLDREGFSYAA